MGSKIAEEKIEAMRRLHEEGFTNREISVETGVPRTTVCNYIKAMSEGYKSYSDYAKSLRYTKPKERRFTHEHFFRIIYSDKEGDCYSCIICTELAYT